ncbi:MAG: DNA mismatch repair protein MutS [Bacteroidaceae bacterium]|nr:DNA mismatch repair protein MutS [Bacteroidaceae bacterium]
MTNLRAFYDEKAAALRREVAVLRQRSRSFVVGELAAFGAAVALAVTWIATEASWPVLLAAGVAGGIYLWIRSRDMRSSDRLETCEGLLSVYEGELAALDGDFSRFDDGSRYADQHHEFTMNLDVFGRESLYQRIDRTATTGGADFLAARLAETSVPSPEEIRQRREAINALAADESLRTAFMAQGRDASAGSRGPAPAGKVDTAAVLRAIAAVQDISISSFAATPAALLLAVLLLGGFYALLAAAILGFIGAGAVMAWAVLEVLVASLLFARPLRLTSRATNGILKSLRSYRRLIILAAPAGEKAFCILERIVASIDRRNEFWIFISNALFLADLFIVHRFLRWRRSYLTRLPEWIDEVSCFDALVSMATFRYNHPEATDAEVVASPAIVFEAEELWHPFLGAEAVRNDFRLDDGHYYIITGANMAGKSTFLRTVGINVLLARCGLPVFARRLRLSPFALFTSMRTTDDLQHGISYFNAELLRLRQLLEAVTPSQPDRSLRRDSIATPPPPSSHTLIILDEILKGTNSLDKLNGSRLFLEAVSALPVTGIIATHDLELSRMADEHPDRFHNHCFEIQLADDITYSYRITPGVARNQNATYLLRQFLSSLAPTP